MTRSEQETIINHNREDDTASVWTADPKEIRWMNKLASSRDEVEIISVSETSAEYIVPKSWVKIRPNRIMTDEQRAKLAERAKSSFGHK